MRISVIFLALTVSQLTSLHAKGLASPIHDSEEAGIRDDGLNEDPDEQPDLEERREAAEAQRAEAEERRQAEAEERSQQLLPVCDGWFGPPRTSGKRDRAFD